MMKWSMFYRPVEDAGMVTDIVFSEREEHGALRRQLAHGFSEKSMQNQEPLIRKYVDMLIDRLHEKGQGGLAPVNMADWYNFTTFDVIGDLAFGESFGCLEDSDYHPWVKAIFELGRVGVFFQAAAHYPMFQKLLMSLIPKSALERRQHHIDLNKAKLQKRMELGQDRPDLIEGLLQKKDDWNLDMEKLEANSALLIIGGSETTATLLSGVTYLLLMNQSALDRLTHEVRSAFSNEEDITLVSAGQLPYMLACLEEALRMYPPVPLGLPRVVPKGGATVAGHFVPEKVRYSLPITNHEVLMRKTVVAVHQWAMYHNDKHFRDPFSYHPERFLGDEQFASDNRDAFQPFHTGPRNCIGRK
ncbi:putative cytochrome p450 protein [Phaeoacremonium minimum UCRPA7]|uniref:Putative cytochrome p450 protein n=1 Tax=Phaeoacremonium minimum (strain UCR-PA7) TaxID=1286976 RepID=R8BA81_PHAM7|nr:putative cytochrome p450 protein [Phaeoacremonium minimum UCRPA7]EON96224.1 putative cytochrome p450 protein [Phaeoacremonium minimum UCRPA7]